MTRRLHILAAVAVAVLMCCGVAAAQQSSSSPMQPGASGRNFLQNSDLVKGAGNSPDHWQSQAWQESPEYTTYLWRHDPGSHGELIVNSVKPNDARWIQSLSLPAGWYYLSGQVRAEAVGINAAGASISVMEDGIGSEDLKGTTDYRNVGFYLKIGKRGADIELGCRLGGFGSLNTGRATCRDLTLVSAGAPAPGARQFDLEAIRKQAAEKPIGSPWTLIMTFLFLAFIAYIGWSEFANVSQPVAAASEAAGTRPRKSAGS